MSDKEKPFFVCVNFCCYLTDHNFSSGIKCDFLEKSPTITMFHSD